MKIENTTFGATTIDGKTYEHDVLIRPSGKSWGRRSCRRSTTALTRSLERGSEVCLWEGM